MSHPFTPVTNQASMPGTNPSNSGTNSSTRNMATSQPFTPVTNQTSMPSQVLVNGLPTNSVVLTPLQLNKLITTPGQRKISAQMREAIAACRGGAEAQDQERNVVLAELTRVNNERELSLTELTRVNDEREQSNQEHQRLDQWDDAFWQGDAMQYLDDLPTVLESPVQQFSLSPWATDVFPRMTIPLRKRSKHRPTKGAGP